jgi:hypothetical protein
LPVARGSPTATRVLKAGAERAKLRAGG